MLAGVLGLSGVVVVAWAAFVNDPLGGEPMAVVATKSDAIDPDRAGRRSVTASSMPATTAAGAAPNAPETAAKTVVRHRPDRRPVTIIDGSSGARQQVTIPGNARWRAPKPLLDPKLIEATRHGAIPKIGPDGAARPPAMRSRATLPANKKDSPLIAIVIGGLGISASGTADAFAKLPATVTFALAPYGADLEKLAERARADQHELLLQVPMEPFDYPGQRSRPADAADLADIGTEYRPAALADEPLPGLCRA